MSDDQQKPNDDPRPDSFEHRHVEEGYQGPRPGEMDRSQSTPPPPPKK
jgi:hypothetical protein